MTPGELHIEIYQGATFSKVLTWKDETNTAVNLTGYTARMQAREDIESTDPFITLTTENSGIALGGSAGTITLTMSASATAALTQARGVYDLELISGGGVVTRLIEGSVTIYRNVTR
jgi:hypothetical protein